MDTILLGLNEVANLNVIMAIVIGALIGVTIGSIPGLEPAGVMAILLPITFSMEPLPGVSLLLGVYGGAWYGGAIPAILMNTPGTPVAVLTTYDGYPMAERGEARRALSIAFTSSFVGGLISVFSLIMLAPILSQVARKFGSAEFAMLAALGMIFVVLAHRKHVVEAAMMLGLGIFLALSAWICLIARRFIHLGRVGCFLACRWCQLLLVCSPCHRLSFYWLNGVMMPRSSSWPRVDYSLVWRICSDTRLPLFALPRWECLWAYCLAWVNSARSFFVHVSAKIFQNTGEIW